MSRINYPDDDVLDAAIRKHGCTAVARTLGIAQATLSKHAHKQGIATTQDPREISDEALVRLAEMV